MKVMELLLMGVTAGIGCGGDTLATEDLRASFSFTAMGNEAQMSATFYDARESADVHAFLGDDDVLTATFRGHTFGFGEIDPGESSTRDPFIFGRLEDLDAPVRSGEPVVVQLDRRGFSSTTFTGIVLQAITIDPIDDVPGSGALIATWPELDSNEITWEIDGGGGSCVPISRGSVDEPSTGTLTLPASTLGGGPGARCTALLQLTRSATMSLDASFAETTLDVSSIDSRTFEITP